MTSRQGSGSIITHIYIYIYVYVCVLSNIILYYTILYYIILYYIILYYTNAYIAALLQKLGGAWTSRQGSGSIVIVITSEDDTEINYKWRRYWDKLKWRRLQVKTRLTRYGPSRQGSGSIVIVITKQDTSDNRELLLAINYYYYYYYKNYNYDRAQNFLFCDREYNTHDTTIYMILQYTWYYNIHDYNIHDTTIYMILQYTWLQYTWYYNIHEITIYMITTLQYTWYYNIHDYNIRVITIYVIGASQGLGPLFQIELL